MMQQALILDEGMLVPEKFVFDSTNENWTDNPEHNEFFLRRYEALFNDMLAARGYLFLNEVLYALGLKRIRSGQILGWGCTPGTQIHLNVELERGVYVLTPNVQADILSLLEEM